jgi:hypothetical protein
VRNNILAFFSHVKEEELRVSPLNIVLDTDFFVDVLINLRNFPFMIYLLRVFSFFKGISLDLGKYFVCIFQDDCNFFWSISTVSYMDLFLSIEIAFYSWNKL